MKRFERHLHSILNSLRHTIYTRSCKPTWDNHYRQWNACSRGAKHIITILIFSLVLFMLAATADCWRLRPPLMNERISSILKFEPQSSTRIFSRATSKKRLIHADQAMAL